MTSGPAAAPATQTAVSGCSVTLKQHQRFIENHPTDGLAKANGAALCSIAATPESIQTMRLNP
ncbi:hypothetical protein ACFYU5_25325 [Nocardia aobensis]|uniref:Uncharacterized protein n=1 Tax=Nocardia aobensis TaxID=257277 RepID=A0ABW6P9A2_9NOCA